MEELNLTRDDGLVRPHIITNYRDYRDSILKDLGIERLIGATSQMAPVGSFYYKLDGNNKKEIEPEYDFKKAFLFYHNEPMVEKALTKRLDLMFKAGWKVTGTKNKVVNYVKKRLTQICMTSGTTLDLFLRELMVNLYKYSNVFICKVRDEKLSSGKMRKINKTKIEPVAAYKIISPLVMKCVVNKEGKVIEWRQYDISSQPKIIASYNPNDIIHLTCNRETGFIWGKPMVLGVIPDIEALRRIEENIQILLAHHIFPLYQYKVGTENMPATYYPDGTSEVEVVRSAVQSLPTQGVVFTPERHEIKVVSDSKTMDAEEYLDYFKNRVYLGLGVSSVDMGAGDTANRGTAITISQNLKDAVQSDQKLFAEEFNYTIIRELLQESPFVLDLNNAFESVGLVFQTVDSDEHIKRENHALTLYTGGIITLTEAREMASREPITEETQMSETYPGFQAKIEAYLQAHSAAVSAAATPTTTTNSTSSTGSTSVKKTSADPKASAVFRKALTIVKPENSTGSKIDPKKTTNSEDAE